MKARRNIQANSRKIPCIYERETSWTLLTEIQKAVGGTYMRPDSGIQYDTSYLPNGLNKPMQPLVWYTKP